jgi:hypothetical protein
MLHEEPDFDRDEALREAFENADFGRAYHAMLEAQHNREGLDIIRIGLSIEDAKNLTESLAAYMHWIEDTKDYERVEKLLDRIYLELMRASLEVYEL